MLYVYFFTATIKMLFILY